MWYVYILKSKLFKYKYIGCTNSLERRLLEHNNGVCKSSNPYKPFELIGYIAVSDKLKAIKLERYCKTGSGSVFLKRYVL